MATKISIIDVVSCEPFKRGLGKAYCDLNRFRFPSWLSILEPRGWHLWDNEKQYRNKTHRFLFAVIRAILSKREQSRAWWLYALNRSEEDWEEWWNRNAPETHSETE